MSNVNRRNRDRVLSRIVSDELESRGFRVSDLNKEGPWTNANCWQ